MNTSALRVQASPGLTPAAIGRAATLALHDELSLTPKPGLVTLIDCGSHDDMDAHTFMRSLFSLRRYFVQIAEAGFDGADFAVLERWASRPRRACWPPPAASTPIAARSSCWACCAPRPAQSRASTLRGASGPAARCVAPALGRRAGARSQRAPTLPGGIAARRHGLRSASEEAALAFPVLFETAVPALTSALARGLTPQQARLDTLFHIMAVLDDSNLAHRGGLAGLRHAQRRARQFLDGVALLDPTGFARRKPLPTNSSRGACRPAARPTRSPRPAG